MIDGMHQFVRGALAMGCWIAGLFFLRFWRQGRDRLFLFFYAAFWLLALHWLSLAFVNPGIESRHNLMWARLVAFLLIIVAILDKNRRNRAA